jgi:hypothetical protein
MILNELRARRCRAIHAAARPWIDKLQHAGRQEATDNLDGCGCGGLLHERPRPAEVGPYDVEPGPCDLGDLRWFNINDFVSGFSEPAGSSVNTGAHVRINPFTQ